MWYAKAIGAYARGSVEAKLNCTEIKSILMADGFTLNAVCGVLGNIGYEGGYNPWRWENDNVLTQAEAAVTNKGYGLYGYTPARKYINIDNQSLNGYAPNFSDLQGNATDGKAQTLFLILHLSEYYVYHEQYPLTYQQYKESNLSAADLAEVWLMNYEMPLDPSLTKLQRREEATYWYNYFSNVPPPPSPSTTKFKWWIYLPY